MEESPEPKPIALLDHLAGMPDPRAENKKYPLSTLLAISILAVLSGADSFEDIAEFGEERADWLRGFLYLPKTTPSHDTFNRVFSLLDPSAFASHFSKWTQSLAPYIPENVVAIDGKALRGVYDWETGETPYMLSAWSVAKGLCLTSLKVPQKTNEQTALPDLLNLLYLKGAIVSLDALHCHRNTAEDIVGHEADYLLALKGNQGELFRDVKTAFEKSDQLNSSETVGAAHGRIEKRVATVLTAPDILTYLEEVHHWPHLVALGKIEETRHLHGKQETSERYYLLSKVVTASDLNWIVRSHWEVENKLHWVMDMVFNEDRNHTRNAAENLSRLRQLSLNLIRLNPRKHTSLKTRRKVAAWSPKYLTQLLSTAGPQVD